MGECKRQSKKNGWEIVQDVSTDNYKFVPQLTMAGYSMMIKETSVQTKKYITHIFLQAGVGGMAAGVVAGVAKYFKKDTKDNNSRAKARRLCIKKHKSKKK